MRSWAVVAVVLVSLAARAAPPAEHPCSLADNGTRNPARGYTPKTDAAPTPDVVSTLARWLAAMCPEGCGKIVLAKNGSAPMWLTQAVDATTTKLAYVGYFPEILALRSGPGAILGALAHALGHHIDRTRPPATYLATSWGAELRADAHAACALARAHATSIELDSALAALMVHDPFMWGADSLKWSDRLIALRAGWAACGGDPTWLATEAAAHPIQPISVEAAAGWPATAASDCLTTAVGPHALAADAMTYAVTYTNHCDAPVTCGMRFVVGVTAPDDPGPGAQFLPIREGWQRIRIDRRAHTDVTGTIAKIPLHLTTGRAVVVHIALAPDADPIQTACVFDGLPQPEAWSSGPLAASTFEQLGALAYGDPEARIEQTFGDEGQRVGDALAFCDGDLQIAANNGGKITTITIADRKALTCAAHALADPKLRVLGQPIGAVRDVLGKPTEVDGDTHTWVWARGQLDLDCDGPGHRCERLRVHWTY